ncbi:MAG: glycosyltransferase family 39 protein, partial [Bacteroidales bacterium]|nr:glycosyltransferase family 39 protein [Bacteroidales bacterium]
MGLKAKDTAVWLPLALVLALAGILRFYEISAFSFSNDELSALLRLQYDDWTQLIREGVMPDYHPAGVQVLLWLWVRLGGTAEAWVRLPFILSGIGAVFMTYLLGRRWYGHASGLIAASALAVLEFPLLYSRLARPYATGMLLVLVLIWLWDRFLFRSPDKSSTGRLLKGVPLTMAFAACMYDHYFCFLLAAIIGLSGLLKTTGRLRWAYLITGLGAMLLFLPHFRISLHHFTDEGLSGWLGPPGLNWPLEHWVHIFNSSIPLAIAAGGMLLYTLWLRVPGSTVQPRLLILWWLLPLIVAWLYSLFIDPVAQHSILVFGFPLLLIALSAAFYRWKARTAALFSISILCLGAWHTVIHNDFYQKPQFTDFRQAANFIKKHQQAIDSGQATLMLNVNSPWYVAFYHPGLKEDIIPMTAVGDWVNLRSLRQWMDTSDVQGIVFVSLKPCPPETWNLLADHFPCLVEAYHQDGLAWGVHRRKAAEYCPSEEEPDIMQELFLGFEPTDSVMAGRIADT